MLRRLKNIFTVNKRQMPRWPIRHDVKCLVKQTEENDFDSVYLGNFSGSGCGIFTKACNLVVQKDVLVIFRMPQENQVEVKGKVISQSVYYPSGTESLKDAIYRFSINFENPLNESEIELIKNPPQISL